MTKKRGQGEGSISQRRDGRWMAQVTMPDGSRRTAYADTYAAVRAKLKELQSDAERAGRMAPGTKFRTVGEFLDVWCRNVAASVRPRTAEFYDSVVRNYCPDLAKIPVERLSPQHLQKLYARLLERGLSPTTVRHTHVVLRRAFASGVRLGVWAANPCALVEAPRAARTEQRTLTVEEARRLLAAMVGQRYEALIVLALATGMRRGELLGMQWDQVDFAARRLRVTRNLQWVSGKPLLQEPKTATSRRMIDLSPMVMDALRAHWERQGTEREALGYAGGWVFPNLHGGPLTGSYVTHRVFQPALERAGCPRIRFHDLRHTAASLMLQAGIDVKVVSEMLGHSTVGITLEIYAHTIPAMRTRAAEMMAGLLGGEVVPKTGEI